ANSLSPTANPRDFGPTRSTFMITVIDHAKPWLTPSSTLAATMYAKFGAQMIMKGTGTPTSQPKTSTRLRPQESARWPETRFATALTTPKLTMNEVTAAAEARWNSSEPISGTTVRSMPTIPPTKALMSTSSEN